MTKLRLSLRNTARAARSSLILLLLISCSSSTQPTYQKDEIVNAIQDIATQEYNIEVKAALKGRTLWIYLPLENLLVKADPPKKFIEKFLIDENSADFTDAAFKLKYRIKAMPQAEKLQEYDYDKKALEKINQTWRVVRRVLFSMERSSEAEPNFICFVVADITNGFETEELSYYLDFKKVSYDFISWTEYQHRTAGKTHISPLIIDDKEGLHLEYKDIALEEFLIKQIQHRIELKFQKPEVLDGADIDKEVLKTAIDTIKIYNFKDFQELEINNLLTNNKTVLNQVAVWARATD